MGGGGGVDTPKIIQFFAYIFVNIDFREKMVIQKILKLIFYQKKNASVRIFLYLPRLRNYTGLQNLQQKTNTEINKKNQHFD